MPISKAHSAQKVGTRSSAVLTQCSRQVCLCRCPKPYNLKHSPIRDDFFPKFSRDFPGIFFVRGFEKGLAGGGWRPTAPKIQQKLRPRIGSPTHKRGIGKRCTKKA